MAAIRRLLRPIVRQLIAYGISYPALDRIVRQLYVEVAEQDFPLAFKRQTDSRLALVTGMNRKEISQLRRAPGERQRALEVEQSVLTHVIGKWMAGPPYADAAGVPRRLPYDSDNRGSVSFARLVRELSVDIPVRSVLDEMLRVGVVELLPNGDVLLQREANVPAASDAEAKLTLLGSDPAEVFATIVHNIEHPEAPRLQRKVVYDNVGAEALAALRAEAREAGEEFVRRANTLLAKYDRDCNPGAPGGQRARVVLGTYYFEDTGAPAQSGSAADNPPPPPGRIRRSS